MEGEMLKDNLDSFEPKKGMSLGKKIGIAFGVLVVIAIVGFAVLALKWKGIARSLARKNLTPILQQSSLTEAEKTEALETLDRFITQVQDKQIPRETLDKFDEEFQNTSLVVQYVTARMLSDHIAKSSEKASLPAQEQSRGKEMCEKLVNGVARKKVSSDELKTITSAIPTQDDKWKTQPWTADEITSVVNEIEKTVSEKEIEPGESKPDFAEDIRAMVRKMKEIIGETVG